MHLYGLYKVSRKVLRIAGPFRPPVLLFFFSLLNFLLFTQGQLLLICVLAYVSSEVLAYMPKTFLLEKKNHLASISCGVVVSSTSLIGTERTWLKEV